MNTSAERHLAKAQGYLEKGDGFHRKAAEEMVEALEADPSLSVRAVAREIGRGEHYVRRLVDAARRAAQTGTFEVDWQSGTNVRSDVVAKTLRDAPLEQVEQIISDLPRDRQKAIGAAAGNEYLKARTELESEERDMPPHERKEREAAAEVLSQKAREASGGFAALGIHGHLEQALEELQELEAFTAESLRPIIDIYAAIGQELLVKAAMVDLELDLQEV